MENTKSKIIPEELKKNIDEVLEQQLFNANRFYAESNSEISELMSKELNNDPVTYLERLKERWQWHNHFYEELLEPAYLSVVKDSALELSPSEVDTLIELYDTACLVDEATLVMSGSIKKYLDYYCKMMPLPGEKGNNYSNLLITPPVETFFAQYEIDHLFYIYLLKYDTEKADSFKKVIMKKYHANDETVFVSRFKRRFRKYYDANKTKEEILRDMNQYSIPEEYKVKHFYFTLEHPERKAIRDIIIYDNLDEKLIGSNLIGISGFLLRKQILEYLNEEGILSNRGYIYEFNKNVIEDALEELKRKRGKNMDKDIKIYRQRGDTCAIACMMMALEYYKVMEKANWYDEKRYYRIYKSQYMCGTPFSALAYHFSKNGLETAIYHEDETLFNNNKRAINAEDFELALSEYKELLERAKMTGTKVVNGININHELIREELKKGNIVIIAGEVVGGYHAVLVSGYEDNKFIVCDPLYKEKQIKTEEEIDSFMNTSIGKWFVTVNNNSKEKKDLLDNTKTIEVEANSYMKSNNRTKGLRNGK